MQRSSEIEPTRENLTFDRLKGIAESEQYRLALTTVSGFGGKQLFFMRQFDDKVLGECFVYGVSRTLYHGALPGYLWFEKRVYRGFTQTTVTGRRARGIYGDDRLKLDTVFQSEVEAPFDNIITEFREQLEKEAKKCSISE